MHPVEVTAWFAEQNRLSAPSTETSLSGDAGFNGQWCPPARRGFDTTNNCDSLFSRLEGEDQPRTFEDEAGKSDDGVVGDPGERRVCHYSRGPRVRSVCMR